MKRLPPPPPYGGARAPNPVAASPATPPLPSPADRPPTLSSTTQTVIGVPVPPSVANSRLWVQPGSPSDALRTEVDPFGGPSFLAEDTDAPAFAPKPLFAWPAWAGDKRTRVLGASAAAGLVTGFCVVLGLAPSRNPSTTAPEARPSASATNAESTSTASAESATPSARPAAPSTPAEPSPPTPTAQERAQAEVPMTDLDPPSTPAPPAGASTAPRSRAAPTKAAPPPPAAKPSPPPPAPPAAAAPAATAVAAPGCNPSYRLDFFGKKVPKPGC